MSALTREDLGGRLGDAERELEAAKLAAGAVEVDGGDVDAASERVRLAKETIERLEHAGAVIEDRERGAGQRREEIRLANTRWRVACWWLDYLERAEPVIRLRGELEAAESRLMALGGVSRAVGAGHMQSRTWMEGEVHHGRLDARLMSALPDVAVEDRAFEHHFGGSNPRGQVARLTVEQVVVLKRCAAQLVDRLEAQIPDGERDPLPWERGGTS